MPSPTLRIGVVPVTPFEQNCSILRCERTGKGAVVDPGGDIDRIVDGLRQMEIELEKILITHGHIDHAGATRALADRFGVPIEGPHRDDLFLISALPDHGRMFGLDSAQSFEPDRWLEDGDAVTVGEHVFEVRHCPGHTPGHVVFYSPEAGVAIVGDVLFDGSIGRTDLPRGNHAQLMQSIHDKLLSLDDQTGFVPGHGPTSTIGRQRRMNPFLVGEFA